MIYYTIKIMEIIMGFEFIVNVNLLSILGVIMVMASIYLIGNYVERIRIKGKEPRKISEILVFMLLIGGIVLFFIPILN